jgi:hypothetical protein
MLRGASSMGNFSYFVSTLFYFIFSLMPLFFSPKRKPTYKKYCRTRVISIYFIEIPVNVGFLIAAVNQG